MTAALRRIPFIALAIVMASVSVATYAQSGNATLQGTVTDPSGAAVPNAQIRITSPLTGVTREAVANSEGFYSAPNLSATRYKVATSAQGFGTHVQNDAVLTVGVA